MPFPFPHNVSHSQTLALTALATAITTTSLILTFQSLRREHRNERLKREVGEDVEEWEKSREGRGVASPEERAERLARGSSTPGGKKKEWVKGEFDEGLIREQVSGSELSAELGMFWSSVGKLILAYAELQLPRRRSYGEGSGWLCCRSGLRWRGQLVRSHAAQKVSCRAGIESLIMSPGLTSQWCRKAPAHRREALIPCVMTALRPV